MYKQFQVSQVDLRPLDKRINVKFNFDVEESSIKNDSFNLISMDGDHINFKITCCEDIVSLHLDEWPVPDTIYQLIIEKEVESIIGNKLMTSIRKKIHFKAQITSKVRIKSPYNFERLEELCFEYDDSENVASYYIEIAKENKFFNLTYSGHVFSKKFAPVIPDLKAGQYYIRIRVQDGEDYGPWSDIQTFIYKYICDDNNEDADSPSANTEFPSAWEDLYESPSKKPPKEEEDEDEGIEVVGELEPLITPQNGVTDIEFVYEFDRELDPGFGEVIVIKREF